MELRPSSIKKNSNIKADIVDKTNSADDLMNITNNIRLKKHMPDNVRSNLVDLINKDLSSEDHIEIYKMLRKEKSEKFFSTNKRKTFFNIKELEDVIKWKLYYLVLLSKDNNNNLRNREKATQNHEQSLTDLNKKINNKKPVDMNFTGQSEKEKYSKMIEMNKQAS